MLTNLERFRLSEQLGDGWPQRIAQVLLADQGSKVAQHLDIYTLPTEEDLLGFGARQLLLDGPLEQAVGAVVSMRNVHQRRRDIIDVDQAGVDRDGREEDEVVAE